MDRKQQDRDGRMIQLGIIGTGLAVENLHWPALHQMPERFRITAFADTSRDKAAHFAAYTGCAMENHYTDYQDLLQRDDVEAVLVTVPIPLSYAITRDCLAAGKDVICEKPPGVDEEEARRFLALEAVYPDRMLLVAENCFYRDDLRQTRALLDAGEIGRVHYVVARMVERNVPLAGFYTGTSWRQRPIHRGGVHLDTGVHHMAQLRLLCGSAAAVCGAVQWANATLDVPSDFTLQLRFASGVIGTYTGLYLDIAVPHEPNEIRLYGSEGTIALRLGEVTVYRADGESRSYCFEGIDRGYFGELVNFYEAIVHGAPIIGTVGQSVHNMLHILRGLDSADRGEIVALDDAPGGNTTMHVPLWRPHGATGLFDGLPGRCTMNESGASLERKV